ncbi:hypothetical protein [Streptomyces tubercidicus]|uniref:hypothetical protein n=1 Tax=Streptomyces tubercidicus TaxID=47759 RepID=UPI002E0FF15A|nr:hypothetical protein OG761_21470 [Streptomyces tubercidicus]
MNVSSIHPEQWEDLTPDDRKIPWHKVTAPDARCGPLSTHLVMASGGMVHTAPWWVDGVLFTDNSRWLDLIRTQARRSGQQFAEAAAPDGPPKDYRAEVTALRRYAETHGLRPAVIPDGNAPRVRTY